MTRQNDLFFLANCTREPKEGAMEHIVEPNPGGACLTPRPEHTQASMQARLMGYEGDPCPECGQLTLVRSGACCKCDTCGATSGCG